MNFNNTLTRGAIALAALALASCATQPAARAEPTEVEISLNAEPAPLYGTLLSPHSPRAVAVILPGSGPTDRDGNQGPAIRAATYRLLAEGLSGRGIATLRIDKRGIGQSAAAAPQESDLRFSHYAADARAWAREAAARTHQRCAWLIGHSEGALVALAAVAQEDRNICGLVLIAGAGRRARLVLEEQLNAALPETMRAEAMATLAELEAGRTVASPPPALAALFRSSVQPYFISWLAQDPAALIASYDGPVFIGQGGTDIQVTLADAQALSAAQPRARLVVWEGVNHVLKVAPADRAANAATYADPSLPLAPSIVADVAGFILERR